MSLLALQGRKQGRPTKTYQEQKNKWRIQKQARVFLEDLAGGDATDLIQDLSKANQDSETDKKLVLFDKLSFNLQSLFSLFSRNNHLRRPLLEMITKGLETSDAMKLTGQSRSSVQRARLLPDPRELILQANIPVQNPCLFCNK